MVRRFLSIDFACCANVELTARNVKVRKLSALCCDCANATVTRIRAPKKLREGAFQNARFLSRERWTEDAIGAEINCRRGGGAARLHLTK
jgi:hypothetical protein